MENDMLKINELLREIKKIDIAKASEMNVLSFQSKSHQENVNSDIIAYLLNPYKAHRQKDKFLKLFLKQVGIPQGELSNIGVYRERSTEENRRIDIVIDSNEWIVGIECKIIEGTGEQIDQLKNYYKHLKSQAGNSNREVYLCYLTKFGKPSETLSDDNKKELGDNYKEISWSVNIFKWLKECKNSIEKETTLYSALVQYIDFIEKLTGQKKEDKTMQIEMVKTILNKKDQELSEDQLQDLALSAPVAHHLRYILPLYDKLDKNKYEVRFYYLQEDNPDVLKYADRDEYIKIVLDRLIYWELRDDYDHGIEIKYKDKKIYLYMGMQRNNQTSLALSTNYNTQRVGWKSENDNNDNNKYLILESMDKAFAEFEKIIEEIDSK